MIKRLWVRFFSELRDHKGLLKMVYITIGFLFFRKIFKQTLVWSVLAGKAINRYTAFLETCAVPGGLVSWNGPGRQLPAWCQRMGILAAAHIFHGSFVNPNVICPLDIPVLNF